MALAAILAPGDSVVQAGMLENGVSVGDRSRMHIRRVPRPGEEIVLPGPLPERKIRAAVVPPRPGGNDWFWARHDPRGAPRADRWRDALESLRGRGPIVSRRTLRRVAETFREQIAGAARRHGVPEALLLAVIAVESAGRPDARSHAGAEGLMQLIPATARRFGVTDSFDPGQNIDGGAAYLAWLLGTFEGDLLLALAGYNAGEGAVAKHRGVPPYSETRDYVVKVVDALAGARELCAEPPRAARGVCRWRDPGAPRVGAVSVAAAEDG